MTALWQGHDLHAKQIIENDFQDSAGMTIGAIQFKLNYFKSTQFTVVDKRPGKTRNAGSLYLLRNSPKRRSRPTLGTYTRCQYPNPHPPAHRLKRLADEPGE
jgi:hypothetical protein